MFQTKLKEQIIGMRVGDSLHPIKGYKEMTLRNYASRIGREFGRTYSVTNIGRLTITRNA